MRGSIIFMFLLVIMINKLTAQNFQTDTISQQEIQKLEWLTGDWKGNGWFINPEGTKYQFSQTERVAFKLDSTALLVEGQGHAGGKIIHNAMAVVTFNQDTGNYSFQSFLQNGKKGSYDAELKEDSFYWYPAENVRYIIQIDKDGNWKETGEYQGENGWYQFFEMKLSKL